MFRLLAALLVSIVSWAQSSQNPPLPTVEAAAQPSTPARTALVYSGKPLRLDVKCGNDEILAAGLNCPSDEPCPLFLELSAVEAVGNRLVAAGNFHTQAATVMSVLVVSEDGRTWTEPMDRIRLGALDQIQFLDFESGWISGQVVISNTPRDPFFLLTTDGGKNWRRRPLWDESRTGVIEGFWFDSKRHGILALDRVQAGEDESRYALFESQTGGEGWDIRQASNRRLTVERRSSNTDLRLRADGPSKSYRIERRQADRWQTIAAFAIDAGACKMEEGRQVEVEPPTDEPAAKSAETLPPAAAPAKPPTLRNKKKN